MNTKALLFKLSGILAITLIVADCSPKQTEEQKASAARIATAARTPSSAAAPAAQTSPQAAPQTAPQASCGAGGHDWGGWLITTIASGDGSAYRPRTPGAESRTCRRCSQTEARLIDENIVSTPAQWDAFRSADGMLHFNHSLTINIGSIEMWNAFFNTYSNFRFDNASITLSLTADLNIPAVHETQGNLPTPKRSFTVNGNGHTITVIWTGTFGRGALFSFNNHSYNITTGMKPPRT